MNYTIYQISNKYTGDAYIGLTTNFNRRVDQHKNLLKSKRHYCMDLQIDYNIIGYNNFKYSILLELNDVSKQEALSYEKIYIENAVSVYNTVNNYKNRHLSKKGKLFLQLVRKSQSSLKWLFNTLEIPEDKIASIINDPSQLTINQASIASANLSISLSKFIKYFN